jgi:transposase
MSSTKYNLKENDRLALCDFLKKSKEEQRAIILLLVNDGFSNVKISEILNIHENTVSRIKNKYLKEGLNSALNDKPRPGQPKKYGSKEEAEIIALACSDPPEGRKAWTVRLMAEHLKDKKGMETINRETVRLVLKKTKLNLGLKKCGV